MRAATRRLITLGQPAAPARGSPGRSRDAARTAPGLAPRWPPPGTWSIEADRPKKARRRGGKSDQLDAVRAARQALAAPDPAQPRTGDTREALRILLATREHATKTRTATVNALKALILTAPEDLRAQFRGRRTAAQVRAALALRVPPRPARQPNSTCARPCASSPARSAPRTRDLESQPQGHPRPGPRLDARPARRARHRPRQRRPAPGHLVPPRPVPHRSRLRRPRRRRADPGLLRPHRPPPAQPLGDRPPTGPCTPSPSAGSATTPPPSPTPPAAPAEAKPPARSAAASSATSPATSTA